MTIFGIDFFALILDVIKKIIAAPLQDAVNAFSVVSEPYLIALEPENYISGSGYSLSAVLSNIQSAFLGFALGLMGVLFLKKGFETYVLWTEGDPDTDPGQIFMRYIQAGALAWCFAAVYPYLIELTKEITRSLNLTALGAGIVSKAFLWAISNTSNLFHIIVSLIVVISAIRLFFAFFKTGVELFLLRAGFPLACMGLLDADRSYFAEYVRTLAKSLLTVVVQALCFSLGLSIIVNSGIYTDLVQIFFGIAVINAGIKTPQLLSQFIIAGQNQGTGFGGKVQSGLMMAHYGKGLVSGIAKAAK